jgi:hypothetical protein
MGDYDKGQDQGGKPGQDGDFGGKPDFDKQQEQQGGKPDQGQDQGGDFGGGKPGQDDDFGGGKPQQQ